MVQFSVPILSLGFCIPFIIVITIGMMTWLSLINTQYTFLHVFPYMHCPNNFVVIMVLKHILTLQTKSQDLCSVFNMSIIPKKYQNLITTSHYLHTNKILPLSGKQSLESSISTERYTLIFKQDSHKTNNILLQLFFKVDIISSKWY